MHTAFKDWDAIPEKDKAARRAFAKRSAAAVKLVEQVSHPMAHLHKASAHAASTDLSPTIRVERCADTGPGRCYRKHPLPTVLRVGVSISLLRVRSSFILVSILGRLRDEGWDEEIGAMDQKTRDALYSQASYARRAAELTDRGMPSHFLLTLRVNAANMRQHGRTYGTPHTLRWKKCDAIVSTGNNARS